MSRIARRGCKMDVMKMDPFWLAGAFSLTGVAAVNRDGAYALEFMMAVAAGGVLALCFSLWKSRQRKADGIDTALWAMIGFVGSMALAFFFAPGLDGRTVPIVGITLTQPSAAFLIGLGATPFIEWMLTGEAFKLAQRFFDRIKPGGE